MIKCRTQLDSHAIKALAKYHIANSKNRKRKKAATFYLGAILLALSSMNAYGIWQKYYGTEPIVIILLKSSVFVLLSLIILFTGIKGKEHNLYRELRKYFVQTGTKYIDYVISEKGIQLKMNGNVTMYGWDAIDAMEADDQFYYFSSKGKHSIIAKGPISPKNIAALEKLLMRMEKQGV